MQMWKRNQPTHSLMYNICRIVSFLCVQDYLKYINSYNVSNK